VNTSSALEQTRVQVEDVAGIGFATGRTTQQQRDLSVCPRLLGKVVVNDDGVFAAIAEVLAHGAARVRRQILHGGRVRRVGCNNNGVVKRTVLFELAHHVVYGRGFLANCHVNAGDALAFLADDGVDRNCSLTGLAVANNQFALTAANGHHRVNGLQPGLYGLRDRLTCNNAGSDLFDNVGLLGVDGPLAVNGHTQGIYHAAAQFGPNGHFKNTAGSLYRVAFRDVGVLTQDHRTDRVALEVQRQSVSVVGKFEHFALHCIGQAVHADDTVGDRYYRALGANVGGRSQTL